MTNANLPAHLAQIDEATLTPLVQRALDRPTAVVLTWTCETLHGGLGTGTAVYRFAGQARDQGETVPWSLILKVLWADPSRADPAHPEWWCREAEAYRSNTLARLPAGLAAPPLLCCRRAAWRRVLALAGRDYGSRGQRLAAGSLWRRGSSARPIQWQVCDRHTATPVAVAEPGLAA